MNGGICTNTASSFMCDCTDTGFTGIRCETPITVDDGIDAGSGCVVSGRSVNSGSLYGGLLSLIFIPLVVLIRRGFKREARQKS